MLQREADSHSASEPDRPEAPPNVYLLCTDAATRRSLKSQIDAAGWRCEPCGGVGALPAREPASPSCASIVTGAGAEPAT